MQKHLKVLIGDNSIHFGMACSDLLTQCGADVFVGCKRRKPCAANDF